MIKKHLLIITFLVITFKIYSQEITNFNDEMENASPEYIEKVYKLALSEFDKQAYEESLKYIRHVIKSDMNHYKLRYLAAHNHWKLGNFDSATTHFQAAIYVKPNSPEAYMDLALLKIQERNYNYAELYIQTALSYMQQANTPIPSKLYNIYSRIQLMKGFPEESLKYAQLAKSAFEQTGTGIKDKLEAMTLEARSQLLLENYEKAELAMQWAIAMRNDNVYAYNLLGYIYTKWSEKSISTDPKQAEYLKSQAIENFNKAKNTKGIVDEFKNIIEMNITNVSSIKSN
ncbi:MAG: tetratricopeptide repeat protein [Spirochaetia bacterium]|nr:tetratricopeptide repeat protein [Spirochaetia bacterium]